MDRTQLNNTDPILIKNIHNFLQNGDKQIKYSPNKDIVLLLGNTGSGKSTLTLYISGNANKLLSQEVEEGTGQYVIIDRQNKISSKSTIVSQTIYPDLVEDAKTNTLYYDCPGFSDTRSAAHEIAATYFIKKVIDNARSVKMVFVVSHNAVSKGEDRQDFILMLQHATDFIKQIEKFKDSIALIVTKIENRYVRNKMVPDEKVIKAIGNYLEQAKQDINEHPEMVVSSGKTSNTKENVLFLLDIFLSKGNNGQYTRIGIFRKPDEPGPISDIELMKSGMISLQNLITENIQFEEAGDKDFGYTVSAKSKIHINGLVEEINNTILKEILNIGNEVEEYFISLEEKNTELEYLKSKFQTLHESFSKIQDSAIKNTITPENFISEIENNVKYFKINIPDHYFTTTHREGDYIKFLNLVSNKSTNSQKSSLLAAGLSELTEYLSDSQSFYILLNNMYQRLSEYDIQKNRNKYQTINVKELNDLFESKIFKEIEPILKMSGIKKMKLNKPKLKLLNKVLDETLRFQIKVTSPEINKIIVTGVNVKISEVKELLSVTNIKFVEVYALHKVFIDTSLDLTGREIQMVIVAPVWEVIGNQRIILDGKPGSDYYPQKASSGSKHGESGSDGQPGEPGGPSGNFIGIGKQFINEEYLHISANGGNGGRGQDGGDGKNGYDGSQCRPDCEEEGDMLITVFYNKADADYPGKDGGNGGNGGIGGYGGHKGIIYIVKVGKESSGVRAKQTALDGHPGQYGRGGNGGQGGRYFHFKIRNYVLFFQQESFEPIDKWAKNGQSGKDGANLQYRKGTWQLTRSITLSNTKAEYKNYLLNNIKNSLQETFLTTFLSEIDNNHTPLTQLMNRKKRYIMNFTVYEKSKDQMKKINKYNPEPIATQSQSYDQYSHKSKDIYYLDHYQHFNNSINFNEPVFSSSFLEPESIKQTPSKPSFPMAAQLDNMKTEANGNMSDQYTSMNLHENLLLSELVLKKFLGKEISLKQYNKTIKSSDEGSAHDLAYRHYLGH